MSAADRAADLQLHILRHADAGDPAGWAGDDALRPLSAKGELQAERLGTFLAEIGFRPDAILSSAKVRALRTAEIVGAAIGVGVRLEPRLAGAFDPAAIDALLADAGDPRRPVLVGHDPDLSQLVGWLGGIDAERRFLPTTPFDAWHGLLAQHRYYDLVTQGLLVSGAWIAICTGAAYLVLRRRDITGG